ncbi:MAG: hypothetical protein HQL15_10195, partial [Candidatus Omnitrophica bacterium]|nr:hypothetical protein [Candidatus Omnitrophota bacterium]
SITGWTNTIAGTTSFLNTVSLTLGGNWRVSTTFTDRVIASVPSTVYLSGTIAGTTCARTITLGDLHGVTVSDDTFVGGTATGLITLGDVTIENGGGLTVGTRIANDIHLGAVTGLSGGILDINTTGTVNVTGAVGTANDPLDGITIEQSLDTTFHAPVTVSSLRRYEWNHCLYG